MRCIQQWQTTATSQEMLQQSSGHFVQGRDFLTAYIEQPQSYQTAQLDSGMVMLDGYVSSINNVTGKFLAESEMQGNITNYSILVISLGTVFIFLFGLLLVLGPIRKTFDETDRAPVAS